MYLVSYDISSNKIRKKVSDKLLGYGKRVQYSVFECDIDKKRYKKLYAELVQITEDMEAGNIRFYYLDKNSEEKLVVIGDEAYVSMDDELDLLFV